MEDEQVYDLGLRIKELRTRKGWSQSDLAKRLGVSTQTVYRYENNFRKPTLDAAVEIARVLDASLDYLMGLNNAPVLMLHNLDREHQEGIRNFIRLFIDDKKV